MQHGFFQNTIQDYSMGVGACNNVEGYKWNMLCEVLCELLEKRDTKVRASLILWLGLRSRP